jgi:hypothetical protein
MIRVHSSRFGWILALTFGLWAVLAQGEAFRYRYVSFDQVELPSGFTVFFPAGLQDSGRVYGTACDDVCNDPHIAFYANGIVTVLQASGFASVVNAGGTVGGSVLVDPQNFVAQAALFRGDEVELIPPQPGEVISEVIALNDSGTALVESDDASKQTYVLYKNGQTTVLDFGPTVTNPHFRRCGPDGRFINNEGIIAGLAAGPDGNRFDGARGFRFNLGTGEAELLDPVSPDTLAWGMGINARGNVLGYSFVFGAPYHERIGVWDSNGDFKTYFVETINTSALVFNDNNLIVISLAPDNTSYLVPKPGVRLNLADLVENLPSGQTLSCMFRVNNHGDMLGSGAQGSFLLQRLGGGGS